MKIECDMFNGNANNAHWKFPADLARNLTYVDWWYSILKSVTLGKGLISTHGLVSSVLSLSGTQRTRNSRSSYTRLAVRRSLVDGWGRKRFLSLHAPQFDARSWLWSARCSSARRLCGVPARRWLALHTTCALVGKRVGLWWDGAGWRWKHSLPLRAWWLRQCSGAGRAAHMVYALEKIQQTQTPHMRTS